SIEKKLNNPKELSLIFNWVLDGYLLLCQNRYFTETPDQKDIMQNFRENIDPLFAFAEDFVFPNNEEFLPTTELYATYSNWCWNNGYETIAVNVFSRMVKPHLEKKGFELIRTNKCRGYSRKKIEQKIWEH
ncbi:MAG TPA: primase-like DNA-binding domain-containing protein, partial [Treponemataceae bacterium]|nr:primase-like DNA-binding domain-containing protein [Treponemataceae bacterium]